MSIEGASSTATEGRAHAAEALELERLHGDNSIHSIALWQKQRNENRTQLEYVDWRADRLYHRVSGDQ